MREEQIEKLRGVVRDCVSKHLYSSAIFFADKVAAVTSDPADIYMQAQALYLGRHYRRAFHLLNASQIVLRDLRFRYLAAKCLEELKEWDQCLLMLGDAKVDEHGNITDTKDYNSMYLDKDGEDREINIISAICFLRGKAYEALENRAQARLWYKAAIRADPLCYEALECLIEGHMLTCEEGTDLSIGDKCKFEFEPPKYDLDKHIILLEKDPFHLKCTLVHLAAAMELGHSNELYLMACNLVKDYPQKALSWFAVGCYYYCIKKYDQSRRYFSKATSLDGTFAPGWIGYGNAYSAQEEGDQAMSAYRTAARLFPGCHLPTLYIGMEYMRTHSFKLAEQVIIVSQVQNVPIHCFALCFSCNDMKFVFSTAPKASSFIHPVHLSKGKLHSVFMQAQIVCPSDPLVYNELGVVAYHMKEYKKAVWWFEKTLAHVPSSLSEMWEPTVVNLAHALRKLKRYNEAIIYYEKALALSTRSLSTYAGLAYTYHLQALWIKSDDQFCTEMLTLALSDECRLGIDPKVETIRSQLFT
ncbi:hypothetical protein DH2020_008517 [Rehmannia glutinosa]|uniref:Anaphase-promoting complex subunit 6 n=1 Tax=Rehmannia glutinosa TaxID=99300 RepID=A0ABR0X4A8_REHGL